jgi:hypothetical protein
MESVLRLILRLFLVPLGGAVAFAVAMILLAVAHWHEFAALADARPDEQGYWLLAFVLAGPVLAFLLSLAVALTLLAAAVGVLISEAFAIRSWIYHAANGGLAAWIGWSLMQDTQNDYRFLAEPRILVAAGLAGGLAYWVVAGSTAGFWKPVFRSEPRQA